MRAWPDFPDRGPMLLLFSRVRSAFPGFLFILSVLAAQAPALLAADLQEDTVRAFERYVQATEARMAREQRLPDRFFYIDSLPEPDRRRILAALKRGDIWLDPLETREEAGRAIRAPHGLITHWVGAAFLPGATLGQVLSVVRDYDHYQDIYKPEMVRSRLLIRERSEERRVGKECRL